MWLETSSSDQAAAPVFFLLSALFGSPTSPKASLAAKCCTCSCLFPKFACHLLVGSGGIITESSLFAGMGSKS